MKKPYCKPQIYFETFRLSSSIANICDVTFDKVEELRSELRFHIFSDEFSCQVPGNDGTYSICYHGPPNHSQLFGS